MGSLSRVGVKFIAETGIDFPVSIYVKDKNIRFLKFSKLRYPNALRLITLIPLDDIDKSLRDIIYTIKRPEHMLLDLDSTLFGTYGNQEGQGFNFHYHAQGYHPLLCYDGLTGDLLKAELRDGTLNCSNDADKFMEPLFQEYLERGIKTYLRSDSGFSSPKLYKVCEMNGCSYAIRLKQNSSLIALASDKDEDLYKATKEDQISYAVTYGEFMYRLVHGNIQDVWSLKLRNHTVS